MNGADGMSGTEGPLTPEVAAMLDVERSRPGMPDATRERVQKRLSASLGLAIGAGVATGTAAGVASAAELTAPSATAISGVVQGAGSTVAGAKATGVIASVVASKVGIGVVCFALGGATALGVDRQLDDISASHPAPGEHAMIDASGHGPVVRVPVAVSASVAASPSAVPSPSADASVVSVTEPSTTGDVPSDPVSLGERHGRANRTSGAKLASSSSAGSQTPTHDLTLAAERVLIERARSALARGDHRAGLVSLARHQQRFPAGRLQEEREALTIQALSASGQMDAARKRADAFRQRTPDSILLPSVEAAPPVEAPVALSPFAASPVVAAPAVLVRSTAPV